MDAARELCDHRKLILLEDAAQSLGSFRRGRHLGTFGTAGILSFSPLKIITTGQGGAVLTDDDDVAAKVRRFKDFGRARGGVDVHPSIGYNFKFTDLQAVIGIEQMKKLPARIARKKEIFSLYRKSLADVAEFIATDLAEVAPWFIDILVDRRDELSNALRSGGIKTRAFYPPVHAQPAYGLRDSFPVTQQASARGLWLPSSTSLDDRDVRYVCNEILRFYSAPIDC
jgi:perosamine synthetase